MLRRCGNEEYLMIELYFAPTGNGRRAALGLLEAGLAFRLITVDFEEKPGELWRHNPSGKIPVLIDPQGPDGQPLALAQSGAILAYVAHKSGRLLPSEARERTLAEQWLMFACSDIAGTSAAIFACGHDVPVAVAENTAFFEQRLYEHFAVCDGRLEGRDTLVGDDLSVADLALYPVYAQRKSIIERFAPLPALARWGESMAARPAVARAMRLDRSSEGVQS